MKNLIRRLSWKVELAIVLTLAFGWTLPSTLRALLAPVTITHRTTPPISDIGVWGVILQELIILALLVPFLRARGWTFARLGIQPSLKGCLQGFLLAVTAYALYFVLAELVMSLWPAVASALYHTHLVRGGFSWTTIAVGSTINPFYEEVFVCGYLITVLTEQHPGAVVAPVSVVTAGETESAVTAAVRVPTSAPVPAVSLTTAINTSAGIRLSYHLYQGVAGVLNLVPTGLLFAIWFARTRQLWPLIVAHAILDFAGLATGAS
jgi:hypothetical protein